MKRLFIVFFLMAVSFSAQAQWIIQDFETVARDTFFQYPQQTSGLGDGQSHVVLSDITSNPTPAQGKAALKCEWTVNTLQSWGGFSQMMHLNGTKKADSGKYFDWSSANAVKIKWYNVSPSTKPRQVDMRFKIHEAGGASQYWSARGDHEDWYSQIQNVYDTTPGWNTLIIPLTNLGTGNPSKDGFTLPGWSGTANNGELDLEKIIGYSLEWTAPIVTPDSLATGIVVWDDLELMGTRYTPLSTFDNVAANAAYFNKDVMGWAAGNKGALTFTDVTATPFEGASTLQVDYTVNADQSWGGYVNFEHIADTALNLSARRAMVFYIKNIKANTLAKRLTLRFILYDESTAKKESWFALVPIDIDNTTDWQQVIIPLDKAGESSWNLVSTGFINPPDQGNDDGLFNLTKITGWKFELSVDATGPVGPDVLAQGSFLLDLLTPEGFRETDKTPPVAPKGIAAVAGSYTNIVTWNDVPGEVGEKYDVFYSTSPITSIDAPGVECVKMGLPRGVQLAEHLLRAPGTDQVVKYYYAVRATDKAGNIGEPGSMAAAISNTAKGITTITYKSTPFTTFKADGNLAEWTTAGIKPIKLAISDGSGFKVSNSIIDNDADCSAMIYVAMDKDYLYAAFDVTDDIFSPTTQSSSWLNDCPDMFIGLYDAHGIPHTSYKRGATPDYHLRYAKGRVLVDGLSGADSLIVPGADYYFEEAKFPKTGWVIESRIPFTTFVTKSGNQDNLFVPKMGMRIPFDFEINDADATQTREGQLDYSPYSDGNAYADVSRWLNTWIGDQWTGVNDKDGSNIVNTYSLSQNYPNPFNPSTVIKYNLAKSGHVTVKVFDVLGREVAALVNGVQNAGSHSVSFNAGKLTSGVYIYKIEAGEYQSVKKMMLVK